MPKFVDLVVWSVAREGRVVKYWKRIRKIRRWLMHQDAGRHRHSVRSTAAKSGGMQRIG